MVTCDEHHLLTVTLSICVNELDQVVLIEI